jgi:ribosome-associated toxin RatA of RatAB toxin-antitoxin module
VKIDESSRFDLRLGETLVPSTAMSRRHVAACALLSGALASCVNVSQPRSRKAVLDQVVDLPKPGADAPAQKELTRLTRPPPPADVAEVETVPVPGSRIGRARATVLVRAPVDKVRAVILDFPHYHDFLPNYESAKVVSKKPDGVLIVHMEIAALGGMIHRWMRVEMTAPVVAGDRESFSAKLLDGDVKEFEASWALDRVPEGTRLTLESHLDAKFELPAAFIDSASASGLKDSILAVKARAEE